MQEPTNPYEGTTRLKFVRAWAWWKLERHVVTPIVDLLFPASIRLRYYDWALKSLEERSKQFEQYERNQNYPPEMFK